MGIVIRGWTFPIVSSEEDIWMVMVVGGCFVILPNTFRSWTTIWECSVLSAKVLGGATYTWRLVG